VTLHIDIDPDLRAEWHAAIERQIALSLSQARGRLASARVRFSQVHQDPFGHVIGQPYRCEFTGRGHDGELYRIQTQHSNGRVALSDAFARIRRYLARRDASAIRPGRP
jgi:hypothetical protein